jgi:hypothetical protein
VEDPDRSFIGMGAGKKKDEEPSDIGRRYEISKSQDE